MIFEMVVHYKAFPSAGLPKPMTVTREAKSVEEALEDLFRGFNHAHPGVTGEMAEFYKVRSMSVGDEVDVCGDRWICAGMGWVNLSEHPEILEEDFLIRMSRENRDTESA